MTVLLDELKTRARLRLNAARAESPSSLRLRDCLHSVAREVGFAHWEQARRVLGGLAVPGDDMGTFWHAPRCNSLLNPWFAHLADARAAQVALPGNVLLPYKRQFILANAHYLRELGIEADEPAWDTVHRDLVRSYASGPWLALALRRLKAPRSTFA